MKCPECKTIFTPRRFEIAAELGAITSPAKKRAAQKNGRKGGRPKGSKNKSKKTATEL